MVDKHRKHQMRDSHKDLVAAKIVPDNSQTRSPAFRLAFDDPEFLCRDDLRPVRLQLEILKPEIILDDEGIKSTIVLFGGARILEPEKRHQARTKALADLSKYYDEARLFAKKITLASDGYTNVIVTGGGPGVMEAGNRGANDAGGRSIGLNIVLPHEQAPNVYVTPELCFNFHYFALRKMHFLMRASAICIFPGGFGTLDEMFESLTLIQTGRMEPVPLLLFGEAFWRSIVNWDALVDSGTIAEEDLNLIKFVETADEALEAINEWQGLNYKCLAQHKHSKVHIGSFTNLRC